MSVREVSARWLKASRARKKGDLDLPLRIDHISCALAQWL
jgi:hypothetical protein